MIVLKALPVTMSFPGLCGILKSLTDIPDTMLPMLTVCAIILFLMLSSHLKILAAAWAALFSLGIRGFIWRFFVWRQTDKRFTVTIAKETDAVY